jgi:hypothetical protein
VPALQEAFGERYGGYWLDVRRRNDVMHLGVVGATDADRATVASLTSGHPRVTTDSVAQGYDALMAAKDEIAASLDPADGHFSVDVDVAANAVVVHTEGDGHAAAATAPEAARRGVNRRAERTGAPPAADPASALRIEPQSDIAVEPLVNRDVFPPHEAGLGITVAVGPYLLRCTTGWMFWNPYYGAFGSTAGHCSRNGDGVVIGGRIVDVVRANGYQGVPTVIGDASLYSLSAAGWPSWPAVITDWGHYGVSQKFSNAEMAPGLSLCFEGVTSGSDNCGPVVRANQTVCCDGGGHAFVFTCIAFPPLPGDSGGPVCKWRGDNTAIVAGMLSSAVTISGVTSMCFSTINNIEAVMGSVVAWS